MKKRKILNALMVLTIVLIAVCGGMTVKTLKGSAGLKSKIRVEDKLGIVTVERNGIAYEVEEGSEARIGDYFRSKKCAQICLEGEEAAVVLAESSELKVEEEGLYLHKGEVFVESHDTKNLITLRTRQSELKAKNTVFTVSAQSGSQIIYVYSGEVIVEDENIKAGNKISIVEQSDGSLKKEVTSFAATALNDAQIELLQKCEITETFCFSEQELKQVIDVRKEEKMKAHQAQLLLADASKEALKKEEKAYEKALADAEKEQITTVSNDIPSNEIASATSTEDTFTTSDYESYIDYEEDDTKYVTIEIRCDTILNNMQNLTPGKDGYVPGSGTILSTSKIEFEDGETVFEVLKRACDRAGIQVEYRWTPMYESYYIEGINYLYEFDCGNESGWMYKVNGWFPNYGCSSYVLEEGDTIVWSYTCNGLGRDLGFEGF